MACYCLDWLKYNRIYNRFRDYTMINRRKYILNLRLVQNYKRIQGSIVECGTWRGGMDAGIASLLERERHYYLFDSFEGLPDAQPIDGEEALAWQNELPPSQNFNNCLADRDEAEEAMQKSGATKVSIIKGFFENTLSKYDGGDIAILRLDADWYESTMQCLEHLFDKVLPGGIVIFDDYYTWPGCTQAVHEFLSKNRRREGLRQYRNTIPYIKKLDREE
jgi:O-methyltransferase